MACLHMKKLLSEYIDGELGAEDRVTVEEHLHSCEDCTRSIDELRKTLGHMRALDDVEPPAWFTQRVMQRVHREAEKKGLLRRLFFPLHIKIPAEALALALVAVVAVVVFDAMHPEVVMKEAPSFERRLPREEPEADVAPPDMFDHPSDEAGKPFAPTRAMPPTGEEGWDNGEMEVGRADEKAAPEKAAQLRGEAEPMSEELAKSEPSAREFRAKTLAREFSGDAEAPVEQAETEQAPVDVASMDNLELKKSKSELRAAVDEPGLRLSVEVEDIDFARHEVQEAIKEIGGRVVDDEGAPANVVMGEIGADKADGLIDAISELGEIKSKSLTGGGGAILLRVELSEKSGP